MADFNKYNRTTTVKEDIDLKALDFKPLKEFCGKKINVEGFFFTQGKYGKQVAVVGNGYKINMPARAVETFENIANNEDDLKAVLSGQLVIDSIKMIDTNNGSTTAYRLTNK